LSEHRFEIGPREVGHCRRKIITATHDHDIGEFRARRRRQVHPYARGKRFGVLRRFQRGIKWASDECGYAARQGFERSLDNGGVIARLVLLPDDIKRALYRDLGPLFGVASDEAANPELEKRIADLEADLEKQAAEREADRTRLRELEDLVLRRLAPESPQQHEKVRMRA